MTGYPELRRCARCLTPMRPRRKSPEDYPFKTLCAGKDGLCHSCNQRDRRGTAARDPRKQAPEPNVWPVIDPHDPPDQITVTGYLRWQRERRRRITAGQVMPSR